MNSPSKAAARVADKAEKTSTPVDAHTPGQPLANQSVNQALLGWLSAIAAGDQQAFSAFYDQTQRIVFGLAQRILNERETAEEVTLDVFLQVWRQAAGYDLSRGTPLAWLMMLTRSRAIDRLRAATHRTYESEDLEVVSLTTAAEGEDPEEASLFAERRKQVRAALAQLTPEQRLLIETAFFEGLSHTEIASRFNLPLGTVKTRIRAGMTVLRKHLSGK